MGFLRAVRVLSCGGPPTDPATLLHLIPDAYGAYGYARARDLSLARVLIGTDQGERAAHLLDPWVAQGDLEALGVEAMALGRDLPRLRGAMEAALHELDDAAPADLRAGLARLCTTIGDAECARFQGVRAAAMGAAAAAGPLCFVARAHPSDVAREDATRWLQALRRRTGEPLDCRP